MSIFLQAPTPNEDKAPKALKLAKPILVMVWGQALIWQFLDVPKGILKAWRNFLWFNLNYFSVPILLKTFISPWRKYRYSYGRVFEVWKNFEVLVFNIMSRIIGVILRTVFIIIGLLVEILIIIIGAIVFLGWLILPFLLIFGIIFGFRLLLI